MFPAVQRASRPTLAVCLLRDCRKSQCNIHSVRLGKPISYFSLDHSGLERQSQSLFLCLPLFCTSRVHSLCLFPHFIFHLFTILLSLFPSLSAQVSINLLLIPLLHPHVSFSRYNIFFLPSAVINHNKREILHWKPGRAGDIHPVLVGQDGRDYKYYISLAVNIFIREWIICWLRACLKKHVCLDAVSQLWSTEQKQKINLWHGATVWAKRKQMWRKHRLITTEMHPYWEEVINFVFV